MTEADLPLTWTTRNDAVLSLRRIAASDFDAAREFLASLSYGTRYFRFGRGDFAYTDEQLRGLLQPDRDRREQVVVVHVDHGVERMVASARYETSPGDEGCEFAIVVRDGWQREGLGQRLMQALFAIARGHGLRTMHCRVLGTNTSMLAFVERLGFREAPDAAGGPIRTLYCALDAAS